MKDIRWTESREKLMCKYFHLHASLVASHYLSVCVRALNCTSLYISHITISGIFTKDKQKRLAGDAFNTSAACKPCL